MGQNESFIGRALRGPLGIDPNSPLGNLSRWNLQDDVIDPAKQGMQGMWQSLTKAPQPIQEPALMPSHGLGQSTTPTPVTPIEGLKGVGITDGAKMGGRSYVMDTKDPNVSRGWMNRADGSGLNGMEWASQNQGSSYQAPPRISTEELYQQSFRDPNSMAPGAGQWAGKQLQDRVGAEDFSRLLGQKQDETIAGAQTQLDPRVRQASEEEAIRSTYPQREAGKASGFAAMLGLQGDQERAAAAVEGARARRDALGSQAVARAIQELTVGPADESPEDRGLRMQLLQRFQEMERGISTGEYFLSDYLDDTALDEIISTTMGGDPSFSQGF